MTTVAADPLPLPADPAKTRLRDFSDRLSPMLVKELRQGLKSHVFTWGLIAMQLALVIMVLVSTEEGNSPDVNTAFWWSITGPVCLLLPLRVANALRDEMSANTLDTLLLTQLSAWRITLGKWLATCALQVLVAVTVLPYLILRYFAGGVNMPLEAAWLGIYILFGMLTTAVMLGLSWFPHFLMRAIVMLGILGLAAGFCNVTIEEISRSNNYVLDELYDIFRWQGVVFFLTLTVWLSFFCLDLGAGRLAPISENRATRRRLVALAMLAVCGACCFAEFPHAEVAYVLTILLSMAAMFPAVQAICERPVNLAPVLLPFVKRGLAGRLAGRLLYPGWHTGLFFALLLFVCMAGIGIWHYMKMLEEHSMSGWSYRREYKEYAVPFLAAGTALGAMIFPLVAWHFTRGMARWDFWRWLLLLIFAGSLHLFVTAIGDKKSPSTLYINYLLPSGVALVLPDAEKQMWEEVPHKPLPANWHKLPWQEQESTRAQLEQEENNERELVLQRKLRQHSIIAGSSLCLWLAAAVWLACRELRVTGKAERELA